MTIYIVRYPFKSYGERFAPGTVITDASKVKHFKSRVGTHIVALDRKHPNTVPTIKFLEQKLGVPNILENVKKYIKAVEAAAVATPDIINEEDNAIDTETPIEQ